jgi:hypothetical protein
MIGFEFKIIQKSWRYMVKISFVTPCLCERINGSSGISGSPYPIAGKFVEEYVDLLHARVAEKANNEIMALHFPGPCNAEFLQTEREFRVSHEVGGLQVGQTCPFNEIKAGVTMAVNIDSFLTHKQFPSFSCCFPPFRV